MTSSPVALRLLALPNGLAAGIALLAGALIPLSLAPFNLWPLGLMGILFLALLLEQQSLSQVFKRCLFFGVGLYGVGVSWIYVSIHDFGGASPLLAGFLTLSFVCFMALMFSLPFYIYGRWFARHRLSLWLAFPACWLLGECFRYWFLTGFPWLYSGYAHLTTFLSGWAPLVGVIGIGFLCALTASVLAQVIWHRRKTHALLAGVVVLAIWLSGALLKTITWTEINTTPISVAMVQPNIPQDTKWRADFVEPTLDLLREMSADLWQNDWLIWPEAAIPLTYHQALPFLNEVNQRAAETHTGLMTGIIYDDPNDDRYYNSIAGFGNAMGMYHKRRLVPFGEYVPLENWLRGLIHFFDLPTSIINFGPMEQRGIQIGDTAVSPSVCYELVYPDLVAFSARDAQVLLTISNLGWFGDSIGPRQFMEMAQMRALETGRYLVYSTNNGSSAFIDDKGRIMKRSQEFSTETLSGEVYGANGFTPFMHWGSMPLFILSLVLLGGLKLLHLKKQPTTRVADDY
jgi:apolipoprotein N-acyltransferase